MVVSVQLTLTVRLLQLFKIRPRKESVEEMMKYLDTLYSIHLIID